MYHYDRHANKEPSVQKSNEEVDTISTLSEYTVKSRLADKDVESKASHNEWESETVPLTLGPAQPAQQQAHQQSNAEQRKDDIKSQLNSNFVIIGCSCYAKMRQFVH